MLASSQELPWLARMELENRRCKCRQVNLEYLLRLKPFSIKVLTGELHPIAGHVTRNGRLRV